MLVRKRRCAKKIKTRSIASVACIRGRRCFKKTFKAKKYAKVAIGKVALMLIKRCRRKRRILRRSLPSWSSPMKRTRFRMSRSR